MARPRPTEMDNSFSDKDLVSPKEYAAQSGFSLPTVRRYLDQGILPKVQPGGFRCRIGIPRSLLAAVSNAKSATEEASAEALDAENGQRTGADSQPPPTSVRRGPKPRWMRRD